jgi:hypothetical protein
MKARNVRFKDAICFCVAGHNFSAAYAQKPTPKIVPVTTSLDLSNLATEIKKFLSIRAFNDALPGHVPPDSASQERVGTIVSL